MRDPVQTALALPEAAPHGGARKGAGRKPAGARAGVSHRGRASFFKRMPVHVTLRVLSRVWNLRSERAMGVIERAVDRANTEAELGVVHFSVQGEHLHLVVEADDDRALAQGMQGLSVRLAKGLNRMMDTRGKVFADRYHAHVLRTPAEVRNALAYVLLNHRSHMARARQELGRASIDRFSSAAEFDGWAGPPRSCASAAREGMVRRRRVTCAPRTWLLAKGWRRRGLLSHDELPASSAVRRA